MNQAAREILIQAALEGHPQIRGRFHDLRGGDCAMGVLHLSMHTTRDEAIGCSISSSWVTCFLKLWEHFGLYGFRCPICSKSSISLPHMNDDHGSDFLAIAHKVPLEFDEALAIAQKAPDTDVP